MERAKTIGTWALTILLALAFLGAGGMKLSGAEEMVKNFATWGLPIWAMYAIGVLEVLAALTLLVPKAAPVGAFLLMSTMIGAAITHAVTGTPEGIPPNVVLFAMAAGVLYLRREHFVALLPGGLKPAAA
ncbi:MAG: DoxX family protein [Myxococcota bacterium]